MPIRSISRAVSGLGSSIIGGAASIGSSALGFLGQQQTKSANAAEAQRNRDWQEQMYWLQHQHQTPSAQVAGLRAAGLNPLLMFSQGGGLGGGAGRVPGGGQAEFGNPFSDVANNVHSARELQEIHKERVKLEAEFNKANVNRTNEEAKTLTSQEASNREQAKLYAKQIDQIANQIDTNNQELPYRIMAMIAQAENQRAQAGLSNAQEINAVIDQDTWRRQIARMLGKGAENREAYDKKASEAEMPNFNPFKDNPIKRWNKQRKRP